MYISHTLLWLEARVHLFVQREDVWEKHITVLPANTLHWALCISIQAVTNSTGCRYVSQHQREMSAKVVSSLIDPVWNQQLPQRKTKRWSQEWRTEANICVCMSASIYIYLNMCVLQILYVTGLFATIFPCSWNSLCRTRSLRPDQQGTVDLPAEDSLSQRHRSWSPCVIAPSRPEIAGRMFWMDGVTSKTIMKQ